MKLCYFWHTAKFPPHLHKWHSPLDCHLVTTENTLYGCATFPVFIPSEGYYTNNPFQPVALTTITFLIFLIVSNTTHLASIAYPSKWSHLRMQRGVSTSKGLQHLSPSSSSEMNLETALPLHGPPLPPAATCILSHVSESSSNIY